MFWKRSRRKLEARSAGEVHFDGEQDGPPERELKAGLIAALENSKGVQRAYLARVAIDGGASVALCLVAPEDETLVKAVGRRFSEGFAKGECLDILFLSPAQEQRLARVCEPFYSRDQPALH